MTGGIVPQSAIVTGLGEAVLEKNRDARLLSPGALLDASLGERLTLRRTSVATGAVREQDAIVRAAADGVVIETAAGIEALRCTGLSETLLANRVPAGLSAKPTLSVRIRSPQPVERDVTLSYITNNFDWQADYIGELSADGSRLSLFGWLTLANGDSTGLSGAATQAVAGKLNRHRVWVDPGRASPISIRCWPSGTTSDIPEAMAGDRRDRPPRLRGTGLRTGSSAAGPASATSGGPPREGDGQRGAARRRAALSHTDRGDRRCHTRKSRSPCSSGRQSRSSPFFACARSPQPSMLPLERVLVTRNDTSDGLGLALPAGKLDIVPE